MKAIALAAAVAAAVPETAAFRDWFTERGVRVEIARPAHGPPWIRGTGDIPAAADRIARVVTDFGRYREIFAPAVKAARVLEGDRGRARLHLVWPYPFPLRNRDAVVEYASEEIPGGGWRIGWRDAGRPGDPREGVRIARVLGETRIEPVDSNRSRVTYVYLGDLGGKFPRSAEEKAWRAEPVEYFRALRRALGLRDPDP
jgi:hypothetical protein